MAKLSERNPASAPGDWYIDRRCIDCGASRELAPGLIVHRKGKSVFARQPANEDEERAAWRAVLVCPTASVGTGSHRAQPPDLFPQELAPGLYRCGYNAESSSRTVTMSPTPVATRSISTRGSGSTRTMVAPRLMRPICCGAASPRRS